MPAALVERRHGKYLLSTDRTRLDMAAVYEYLNRQSYWAKGRPLAVVEKAIEHSNLLVGAYSELGDQVGFARMVTDLATYAYLCDVYVLPEHQGTGLGAAVVQTIVEHPDVADIKWQFLATADAHGLYRKFGYTELTKPERWMHRRSLT